MNLSQSDKERVHNCNEQSQATIRSDKTAENQWLSD